jgi:hypothetical protein
MIRLVQNEEKREDDPLSNDLDSTSVSLACIADTQVRRFPVLDDYDLIPWKH